jgi:aspartyl/asparaginyl beta-hydroxylase (cupin superfamily)
MNPGAFLYKEKIFSNAEISEISTLSKDLEGSKRSVHAEGGTYSSLKWFQVDLDKDWNFCKTILSELSSLDPELLVFYYLEPGAVLHPHRDLTGASMNNRIRFHVPVVTNPGVEFIVNNEKIKMAPGDLWCLDTSYVHSVRNDGNETRVHIIIECNINDKIKNRLPGGYKAKLHSFNYALILGVSLVKAIFINSIKNPKYFLEQMSMVYKFIKWRVFKSEKPK